MVKFGRRLVEERYPEWREFYIRYKELKNALYAEREDVEGGEKSGLFLKTLETEIAKVRVFFLVPQSVARSRRNNL
jgi:SPX domain protein involved in polyphosphate accumulation|tara:strand:+ start:2547 stop:2774 length:228 start_codon:yes stop_codon:yes gene_type:complete